ncbi:LysR family transcriptional regulator [Exilibacterium tricleocarpae]|uniref:LysR family transcriptional regulator n=1 Tax=Exilibacterium tricleocarpae TaxID=2591008 RepID=A0A545TAC8_9GAMM|nr:LysR family transcriptional regulator [Exilibacterium tricleocarpae]TQV74166.1 LysR family transcriptional regulator [Exilibacterium tricleocarpae]
MNLRSVDLNLLVILDALLDEAHVSRAAEQLSLSQSATSNALERCRLQFNDVLLERKKGRMRLTPRAEALRIPIKNVLADVTRIMVTKELKLTDLKQTVRLSTADQPAALIASQLCEQLHQTAPGIDLIFQPWHGADAALEALEKGDSDLAISVFYTSGTAICRTPLLTEQYVVAMRKDHPLTDDCTLDNWLSYPHVLISGKGDKQSPLDQQLAKLNKTRKVGVVVPSFLMVPPILAQSNFVAMVPSLCISTMTNSNEFVVTPPPLPVDGFPLHLAWHSRRDRDTGVQHVVKVIAEIFRGYKPSVN